MDVRSAISGLALAAVFLSGAPAASAASAVAARSQVPAADPAVVISADAGGATATMPGVPDGETLAAAAQSHAAFSRAAADDIMALGTPSARKGGVVMVGDLDGDRRADRLVIDQPVSKDATAAPLETVTYRARSGQTRKTLWRLAVPGQVGAPVSVRTGDGGLVLATVATTGTAAAKKVTLTLHGVTDAGEVRWTKDLSGTFTLPGTFAFDDYPLLRQPVRLATGRDAVHVELLDWLYGGSPPYPSPGGATAVLVDARSGREVGRPTVAGNGLTMSFPAGDITGDGNGDVAFTIAPDFADGAPGELWAANARGRVLWGRTGVNVVTLQSWTTAVGDADGDDVGDIAVGDGSAGFGDDPNPGVVLYSGASGKMVWAREGELPAAAGDLDGDGNAEVLLRTFALEAGRERLQIRVTAVRPDGTTLYRAVETTSLAGAKESFGTVLRVYLTTAEMNGDGVGDLRHEGFATSDDRRFDVSGTLSGRTGRRMFLGSVGTSVGRGIRRGGQDLIRATPSADGMKVRLAAVDGANGTRLWRRTVALDAPLVDNGFADLPEPAVTASAGDVNHDRVNDVAVIFEVSDTALTTSQRSVLLDGVDGRVLSTR